MKTGTRKGWTTLIMGAGVLCLLASCAASTAMVKAQNAKQRSSIRRMHDDALTELYRAKPAVKVAVEGSAGYAVFSDFGLRNIYMEDARAMGVALDNETEQETFMKMVQLQAEGPSKDTHRFRLVFIFETDRALRTFTKSAWILGPDVMATAVPDARTGPFAGAVQLQPGIHVFQLDEHGVLIGFTVRDVMFYRDRELQ